ncbi:MAG: nucleotidyltransferase family protein [Actinobacteria bacterium]|nr:nucleotidyltransferase family protein [Thermoleophilia bacterium]MCB9011509.1 nucleotidyltransferase family protein [Actinomycetota bacterium]
MRVTGLVLAAGASSRLGRPKQLVEVGGRPLVVHAVDALLDGGVEEIVVVVGAHAESVASALPDHPQVRAVTNPDHHTGLASSLQTGLDSVGPEVDAVVVLVGDQPGISGDSVRAVIASAAPDPGFAAVAARYDDARGHPVLLRREVFPRLMTLAGDTGARDLLRAIPVLEVPVGGPAPPDIDTEDDLRNVRRRWDAPGGAEP